MVTSTPARSMLDALMDAGYSLRDAAKALNLTATDLLDASESAAEPLAALDRLSRQVAYLQVLDSNMQALKALVQVCNDTTDLEKKRLAAQAILRFDPWRVPRATGNGGRSNPPRSPRETRESPDDTPTPLPVPNTPRPLRNGEASHAASIAPAEATECPIGRVPRLDRPLPSSTPSPRPTAGKPCEESSISVHDLARVGAPQHAAAQSPRSAPAATQAVGTFRPLTPSPLHPFTPSVFTPAALAAAAGHAISIFAFLPQAARAPPARAAA